MRLLILGAGGFAKEVADLVLSTGHEIAGFYEEAETGRDRPPHDAPLFHRIPDSGYDGMVVGVGDTALRRRFYEGYSADHRFPVLIHPSACVSSFARVGDASLIMQGCVVNADAHVGENVLLNVGCCVAHDCRVGDHAHLAPAVMLGGWAHVGVGALCGTATAVLPRQQVGAWSVCGAGSVVVADVPDGVVALGVPARVERKIGES